MRTMTYLAGIAFVLAAPPAAAADDPLGAAVATEQKNVQDARRSQEKIDRLSDAGREMFEEYRQLSRQADTLETYNAQLERLVASQEAEKASLQAQIDEVEVTHREIVPLMLRMVDTLERFIDLDLPFLEGERRQRLADLRGLMDRADVTMAEKYRRVLDAYRTEVEYGRTIESYRGELASDGRSRTVQFLRLGRVALYYQTLDGRETGYWDADDGAWRVLPDGYRPAVAKGLRIARKQAAPELLRLPVPAPKENR